MSNITKKSSKPSPKPSPKPSSQPPTNCQTVDDNNAPVRCGWCGADELYCRYHDEQWGVPVYDRQKLFEFLILEGAQAGLSWITVYRERRSEEHTSELQSRPHLVCR